jgi:hypothetical protein
MWKKNLRRVVQRGRLAVLGRPEVARPLLRLQRAVRLQRSPTPYN